MNTLSATDATLVPAPYEAAARTAPAVSSDVSSTQPPAGEAAEGGSRPAADRAPTRSDAGARTQHGGDCSRQASTQFAQIAKRLGAEQLRLAIEHHTEELTTLYQPINKYEEDLVAQIGNARGLKEYAANLMVVDLLRSMERAGIAWDIDRGEHIDKLAGRVHKDMRVAGVLARTRQGTEWLLVRWGRLRWPLDANKVWTDSQRSFALDLLGVDPELRAEHPVIRPDADVATLKKVVEQEVGRLRDLLDEKLLKWDEAEQKAAKVGLGKEADSTTKTLMKLEQHAWRELQRLKQELHEYRALSAAAAARAKGESAPASPAAASATASAKAAAAATAASGNRPATPAPTPQPVPRAEEKKSLGERWYYDTVMREAAEFLEAVGPEPDDEPCPSDEEPAHDQGRAPVPAPTPAPAAGPRPSSPGRAASTIPEADTAHAREERERRHRRAEERKARNKARRRQR